MPAAAKHWAVIAILLTAACSAEGGANRDSTLAEEAMQLYDAGELDSALAMLREALAERPAEPTLLNYLGMVHDARGSSDSALAAYREAIRRADASDDSITHRNALLNLGNAHRNVGRPDSSAVFIREALEHFVAAGDSLAVSDALNNLGLAYNDIGRRHHFAGRSDSARFYYARARAQYDSALVLVRGPDSRYEAARTLNNLGVIHRWLERPARARAYYDSAHAILRELEDHEGVAMTLHNIGLVHGDVARSDSALIYLDSALAMWSSSGNRRMEGESLYEAGVLHRRRGEHRRATQRFADAAAAVAALGGRAGGDANKMSMAEQQWHLDLFRSWALAWIALDSEVGPDAALSAIAATERGRAQALLDLVRAGQERDIAGARPTPVSATGLAQEGRQLLERVTSNGASVLYYGVAGDTLLVWLALPGGETHVRVQRVSEAELAETVNDLRWALGVDNAASGANERSVPVLERTVIRGVTAGRRPAASDRADWRVSARRLGAWLLPPDLLRRVPEGELLVVPSGVLNLVPFGILFVPGSGSELGATFALRYAPSLAIQAELEGRAAAAASRGDPLIVGNPAMPTVASEYGARSALDSLPAAGVEARQVATLLDVSSFGGDTATETAVKRLLSSASLVHLATHGYAYGSAERARDSFIALAPDSANDGLLTVGEILDEVPRMQAELVVLSACQTGLGELRQAEGTVGLQRAFLAKGAGGVLVSLWSVSDPATRLLMTRFYEHWRGGQTRARALAAAQRDVRDAGFDHPKYWAAFQLVGGR